MKLKPQTAIALSIAIVLVGVITTASLGLWTTQSTKTPQKFRQGENAGQYNPADIRGSYTFSEISGLFGIPIEDLADAFSVPQKEADGFSCKDLETVFAGSAQEIGTGSVRMFVAYYLGLPYEAAESTWLPESAVQILAQKAQMTPQQLAELKEHTAES